MNITRMGIDLAKNVFQLHGVDDRCIESNLESKKNAWKIHI